MENQRNNNEFPLEITFKVIFHNKPFVIDMIKNVCAEHNVEATIYERESKQGKFISYTIVAVFEEESILNATCSHIQNIDGFITMF